MHRALAFIASIGLVATSAVLTAPHALADIDCAAMHWDGGTGAGTAENPFKVASQADLANINSCLDKVFTQTADITLTGTWTPIGFGSSESFVGEYDGKEHTIKDLKVESVNGDFLGMFWKIGGGSVKNLTLSDVSVHRSDPNSGNMGVGGLAGWIETSTVENVTVSGVVDSYQGAGMLAGYVLATTLKNITVSGQVGDVVLENNAGGVAAEAVNVNVSHVRTSVTVAPAPPMGLGGGEMGGVFNLLTSNTGIGGSPTVVDDVIATGAVTGLRVIGGAFATVLVYAPAGGGELTINRVHTTGNVTGGGSTGGVIGILTVMPGTARLSRLSSTGDVLGTTEVGGIIGTVLGLGSNMDIPIGNLYATGAVTAVGPNNMNRPTGGLIGEVRDVPLFAVSDSYATSKVTAPNSSGPLVGSESNATGIWHHLFWNPTDSGLVSSSVGTESTVAAMKQRSTYADVEWPIVNGWVPARDEISWGICPYVNNGYPYLLWQYETNPCVPGMPGNVVVVPSDTTATVTWQAPANAVERNLTGYAYRLGSTGEWVSTGSTATTLTLTGLTPGTEYTFKVRARNAYGYGDGSADVSFTTTKSAQTITPVPSFPKTLKHPGRTVVFPTWLTTNAGQRVHPSVSFTRMLRAHNTGDVRLGTSHVTKAGKFVVAVYTKKPVKVRITLRAKATSGYLALNQTKVYRLK